MYLYVSYSFSYSLMWQEGTPDLILHEVCDVGLRAFRNLVLYKLTTGRSCMILQSLVMNWLCHLTPMKLKIQWHHQAYLKPGPRDSFSIIWLIDDIQHLFVMLHPLTFMFVTSNPCITFFRGAMLFTSFSRQVTARLVSFWDNIWDPRVQMYIYIYIDWLIAYM